MPKLTLEQRAAIVAARASGKSVSQIARDHNVTRKTVYQATRQLVKDVDVRQVRQEFRDYTLRGVGALTDTLDRSREDYDPYKASAVYQTHLKGIGVYRQDSAMVGYQIDPKVMAEIRELFADVIDVEAAPAPALPVASTAETNDA